MTQQQTLEALDRVRFLRRLVLEKRLFRGYSGVARAAGGAAALCGAIVLSAPPQPGTPNRQFLVWGVVLLIGLAVNYGALLHWFWTDQRVNRDWRQLIPALDAVPPLAIGAAFTVALLVRHQYDCLYALWMCLFGLAHVSSRHSLPAANYGVGLFYMLAGVLCLFWPGWQFGNPWPMGIVFCVGEVAGGMVFHPLHQRATLPVTRVNRELAGEQAQAQGQAQGQEQE